jgi:hypothetical protein
VLRVSILDFKVKVAAGVGTFIAVRFLAIPFFDISEQLLNYIDPDDEPEDTQ